MSRQPEVLWAQRSDKIYLTVALPDAKDVVLKCEHEGVLSFSAIGAEGESFKFDLALFGTILPERSKTRIGLRNINCSLQKENKGWWQRLLKSEERVPYIKVDWNQWCDEDDEDSERDSCFDDDLGEEDDSGEEDDGLLYIPDLKKASVK